MLTLHPANVEPPSTTPAVWALAATLPPERFAALYRQKRMTLRDIAALHHVDRKTVAALAHRYGIDTRHKPRLHEEIGRDWLSTEYVVHRRTLPDLAAEKGMTTMNMSRWAQRHGSRVDPRPGQHRRQPQTTEDTERAPALLRPALRQIGGAARLNRFETVLRYPTLTAAAADLGLRQAVLTSQITRLEHDLGAALMQRAQRGHPMTITEHGAKVLRAWKAWKRSS